MDRTPPGWPRCCPSSCWPTSAAPGTSRPRSVSELAQRSGMTIAHASLVVGELAKAGLVSREHDEQDRRRILVSLSETAKPAVAEMRRRKAKPVIAFLRELDEAQAEEFIGTISLL